MRLIFKLFVTFFFSIALAFNSYAVDAPSNFKVESVWDNSIDLSWDLVDNAWFYNVYYGKNSNDYDMYTDVIEGGSTTINNLENGVTYYFVVTSIDEVWEESLNSKELMANISNSEEDSWNIFSFDSISAISNNELELGFSLPLDSSESSLREFKVKNKNDSLDSFYVVENKINNNDKSKLKITLDRDLEAGSQYEIIVVSLTSSDGKNIESGIDNMKVFNFSWELNNDISGYSESVDINNSTENQDLEKVENIELNSAEEKVNQEWPSWELISNDEINNTVLWASTSNEKLPQTWPEHIFMLILSIILGALIFIFRYKKEEV